MNPIVPYLLQLRSDQNWNAKITLYVFYHPVPKNTMADNASRQFDLNKKAFLSFSSSQYSPQSAGSWIVFHQPTSMVSSVICALRKLPFAAVTCQTSAQLLSMQTSGPSAPTSASSIFLITLTTQWSRSFKCLDTVSRNGSYYKKSSVRADTVYLLWRAISTTHLLEGQRDPRKPLGLATRELDLRLSRQLIYYSFLDQPAHQEKEMPL